MEKVRQCVVKFYAPGTLGAEGEKNTLENVIPQMNIEGWRVDQIIPISFHIDEHSHKRMDVTSGMLLCSKIE